MKKHFLILTLFLTAFLLGGQVTAQSLQNGNAKGLTKSAKGKALGIQKQVEGTILGQKGDLPTNLVVKILQKAHPHFNMNLGQMVSAYTAGSCCILEVTQVGEKGRAFLVNYAGGGVVVIIFDEN